MPMAMVKGEGCRHTQYAWNEGVMVPEGSHAQDQRIPPQDVLGVQPHAVGGERGSHRTICLEEDSRPVALDVLHVREVRVPPSARPFDARVVEVGLCNRVEALVEELGNVVKAHERVVGAAHTVAFDRLSPASMVIVELVLLDVVHTCGDELSL